MSPDSESPVFDSRHFREVLGQYPTGVCVVSALGPDGKPAGMAVGSFTSVSLDPPLVAFLPAKSSSSWPKIQSSGKFCINVLAASQERICRALAAKSEDKFQGFAWRSAGSGSPMLEGAVAWIDCDLHAVHEAGDHYIVIGKVRELEAPSTELPLLFFRGGYGRFSPLSFVTGEADLIGQLRLVDLARDAMEKIAADLRMECGAATIVDDELVYLATAGRPRGIRETRVGRRVPFIPPVGIIFAAWGAPPVVDQWLSRLSTRSDETADEWRESLSRIRERGFAFGLGHAPHDAFSKLTKDAAPPASSDRRILDMISDLAPGYRQRDLVDTQTHEVRTILVPVFGPSGRPILQLALLGLPHTSTRAETHAYAERLMETASVVSNAIGGIAPQ